MTGKTFWRKFIFILVCLFLLDFAVGSLLDHFYFTIKGGARNIMTVALEQQENEIVILGSSRASHHYNPKIISDSTNLTCFNAGRDGQGIIFANAVLEAMLTRYTPKIVILDVNTIELRTFGDYDKLRELEPYAKKKPTLWNTLSLVSATEKIKNISRIYPYNSMIFHIIYGHLPIGNPYYPDGFIPLSGSYNNEIPTMLYNNFQLDPNKLDAFHHFCNRCKENNIKLWVFNSPSFVIYEGNNPSGEYIEEYCRMHDIFYKNFINDSIYYCKELFSDPTHLNTAGAEKYSAEIGRIIQKSF